ncbi:MAG: DUF5118 domain-containing protein, partial [Cyclobacteriaceae bacterium]|nr:DUF5118 domain-containing protein [Cyclobacteriaceae bacterium]
MKLHFLTFAGLLLISCAATNLPTDNTSPGHSVSPQTSIAEKTKGMKHYKGYFDFYYDESTDKIWLVIDKFNEEILYVNSLS